MAQRDALAGIVDLLPVSCQLLVLFDEVGWIRVDDVKHRPLANVHLQIREDEGGVLVFWKKIRQRRRQFGVDVRSRGQNGHNEMVVAYAVRAKRAAGLWSHAWRQFVVVVISRPSLDPHKGIYKQDDDEEAPRARDSMGEHRRYRS